jgi:hypothetical protein
VKNFKAKGTAQVWRLASDNVIKQLPEAKLQNGKLMTTLPDASVTLLVLPAS